MASTDVANTDGEQYDSVEDGFLFKPIGENSGNLVILLPSKYRESQVVLKDSNGNVLAQGTPNGYANGDRQHFRFDKSGNSFPSGTIVEMQLSDGTTKRIKIDNPSMRVDVNGVSSGELENKLEGNLMSFFNSSSSVAKPSTTPIVSKSTTKESYSFKSPVSVLDTMHTAAGIVVSAARNYGSLYNGLNNSILSQEDTESTTKAMELFLTTPDKKEEDEEENKI